jgi:pimeloyl-ACP methyl ester carboxylesterase
VYAFLRRASGHGLAAMVMIWLLAMSGGAAAALARAPRAVKVDTVCLRVHNGSDRQASTLFGRRYRVARTTARTPAIVLVHGVASSTANWDFLPRLSVARSLARQGYVVISYDRLGFARSPYHGAGGGKSITSLNQQAMLHEVVRAVHRGTYRLGRGSTCTRIRKTRSQRSRRVVIIGHSAGGGIVEGYPGTYHDVAAMVQADWSSFPPLSGAPAPTVPPEVGQQLAAGKDYIAFFANRQECESFNQYALGAVARAVRVACNPRAFIATPAGEFLGFQQLITHNLAAIKQTGRTPVLLTWGDHDYIFPPDSAAAEYKYWVDNCPGCDLTATFLPRTGHLFMVHRSLPDWVRDVTDWLRSRGLSSRG